jgi:hypothetical protein
MKSLKFISTVLFLFLAAGIQTAKADRTRSVTVTNNTTFTMSELYASPSADSSWDTTSNLLTGQTVGPGQTTTITISDGTHHCHYDLMAVLYGAAEHAYQYQVDTCDGGRTWNVQ